MPPDPPGGTATRSTCRRDESWRTSWNSIAMPLESMKPRSVKSTTSPRAEELTPARIASPVTPASAMSSSPVTRAITISPRSSRSSFTRRSATGTPPSPQLSLQPHPGPIGPGSDLHRIHERAHEREPPPLIPAPRHRHSPRSRTVRSTRPPSRAPATSKGTSAPAPACSTALVAASPPRSRSPPSPPRPPRRGAASGAAGRAWTPAIPAPIRTRSRSGRSSARFEARAGPRRRARRPRARATRGGGRRALSGWVPTPVAARASNEMPSSMITPDRSIRPSV